MHLNHIMEALKCKIILFNKIRSNNPIVAFMLTSWCLARKDYKVENSTSEVGGSRVDEVLFLWDSS